MPSAAAVIGTVTWQRSWSPLRVKTGWRADVDLDVEVAGRATAGPDLALAGELDAGALVDAGRDGDGERAARADPAVAAALEARVGDDRAVAVARGARARRADVAEQRALHVLDVAVAVAGAAGDGLGAFARAGAVAGRAGDGGVDLDLAGDAERGLGEVDRQAQQGVLAALDARARAARRGVWPKNASMMSSKLKPWPKPLPARRRSGSPPRS